MNQYRFDINNDNPEYDGPPCPRVVECGKCHRIMEAPLLEGAEKCCLRSLKRSLEKWMNEAYAVHMSPNSLEMALAEMALDALMYDMERGYTSAFMRENPDILKERDKYMNKRLAYRLRKNGFQVHIKKDGTIDARELFPDGDGYLDIEIDKLESTTDELDIEDDSPWKLDSWK